MISILVSLVLVFSLQLLFYSWWWIIVIPLALGFIEKDSVAKAAGGNGLGIFLLWFGMSVYQWLNGGEIIVTRVSEVMGIGSGFVLALATGIIGFLVAALAGYAGFSLRKVVIKEYQIS
ncbi:MAG: hypothetical protein HQ507_01805 [Candidatus Marinimicrobia bacterium]|jgi:hypothetical protein|nr:hypothetical protein [Candidatus Neomarinimicrobiota bacterium]